MINVVLVGGSNVQVVVDNIDTDKYTVTKAHHFVKDAFNDIMENYAEYLDVNVILVIQHGIKGTEDSAEQIRDLQEVMCVTRSTTKLYFVLNDLELYNNLEQSEEPVIYDKARIIHIPKIYNKHIMDIIEGKMDNVGISLEVEDISEEYTEDDLGLKEIAEEEKVFKPISEPVIERPEVTETPTSLKDLKDLKKGKKGKKGGFGIIPTRDKSEPKEEYEHTPAPVISNNYVQGTSSFTGVVAVTGDRNSGVSTTASAIAETFAKSGKTVLIMDFDLKRRFQTIIYPELNAYEYVTPRTQLGLYYALNNTASLEDMVVIVRDNVALLGNSRKNEYYTSPFVDKTLEHVATASNINTLVGVAKGIYDVVVLDLPLDQLEKVMAASIIPDKYIICVENAIHQIDNLFNIRFGEMMEDYEVYITSMMSKSSVVLTRYSNHNKYGRTEMTPEFVESMLQAQVYTRMKVLGKISYSNVYSNIGIEGKSIIGLYDVTRSELVEICNNLGR